MRKFYKILLFCALIAGSLTVTAQVSFDAEQSERNDISKSVQNYCAAERRKRAVLGIR